MPTACSLASAQPAGEAALDPKLLQVASPKSSPLREKIQPLRDCESIEDRVAHFPAERATNPFCVKGSKDLSTPHAPQRRWPLDRCRCLSWPKLSSNPSNERLVDSPTGEAPRLSTHRLSLLLFSCSLSSAASRLCCAEGSPDLHGEGWMSPCDPGSRHHWAPTKSPGKCPPCHPPPHHPSPTQSSPREGRLLLAAFGASPVRLSERLRSMSLDRCSPSPAGLPWIWPLTACY